MKQNNSEYSMNGWFLLVMPVVNMSIQTLLMLIGIFVLLVLLYIVVQKRKKSKKLLKTLQDDMDLLVRKKTGELQEFNFALNEEINNALDDRVKLSPEDLLKGRLLKFRKMCVFTE